MTKANRAKVRAKNYNLMKGTDTSSLPDDNNPQRVGTMYDYEDRYAAQTYRRNKDIDDFIQNSDFALYNKLGGYEYE